SIFLDIVETVIKFCYKIGCSYVSLFRDEVDCIVENIGFDFEFFTVFVEHCNYHMINLDHLFPRYIVDGQWHFAETLLQARKIDSRGSFFNFLKDYDMTQFSWFEYGIGSSLSIDDFVQIFL